MKRIRLIVHLGLHKTGTTSIQQYLSDNPYSLNQVGIHYPTTGRHPVASTQHGLLAKAFDPSNPFQGAFELTGPIDRDTIVGALIHEVELGGQATVIVSSEELCRLGGQEIHEFGDAFRAFDIYPVVFIRHFSDLFNAYYGSWILYGRASEEPFLEMNQSDYFGRFQTWASVAARRKVCVVDFDASPTGDSVHDFLDACEIDSFSLPSATGGVRLNKSVPSALVTMVRELRREGVAEQHVQGLVSQLAHIDFGEAQTNIPLSLSVELDRRYKQLFSDLRDAPFVKWFGTSAQPLPRREPIHIADLAAAVFALGRALAPE